MESSHNRIDPENEVKKLQELVKKLERQNELLRTKQQTEKKCFDSQSEGFIANGNVGKFGSRHQTHNSHSHQVNAVPSPDSLNRNVPGLGLEDVDVLDVDKLSLKDEEDSWLYSSPKPLTPQQCSVDVYQWMRQDFDHPSPELLSARKSLICKLDEVARCLSSVNRSCSSPVLGSSPSGEKTSSALSRSADDPHRYNNHWQDTENTQHKKSSPVHHRHSMLATAGSRVENGTFTRRRKVEEVNGGERQRGEEGVYNKRESTEVERLARQQEESLRQSMGTYPSPKRVLHNKSLSMASDTDTSQSPAGSCRSSPGRFGYEGSFFNRHRNSFGSDGSTPPDSPGIYEHHSTPHSEFMALSGMTRPRLQHPPSLAQTQVHSSDSSLDQPLADGPDDFHLAPETRPMTSRLQAPGYRSTSPVGAPRVSSGVGDSQGASALPVRESCLPTPRRGIPRPATATVRSSLPMPRRSGIPSPRPSSASDRNPSWRDGCF